MKLCKELIEIHLARRSMTAKDLCRIGIASNTIVRAMRGENLTTKTAGRIARALGVDVTEILKQED
jgi:DNA-binding Xre family transcriptional regulator